MRYYFMLLIMVFPFEGISQQVYVKQFRLKQYQLRHHVLMEEQGQNNLLLAATALRESSLGDQWQQPVLLNVSRSGNVNWARSYEYFGDHLQVSDIEVAPDGTIYVAGAGNLIRSTLPTPFLMATDPTGELKWFRFYQGLFTNETVRVETSSNGDLYLASSITTMLSKVNTANGKLIWTKEYTHQDWFQELHEFQINADGTIFLLSKATNNSSSNNAALVIKLNPDGAVIKARKFSSGSENFVLDLTLTKDRKLVLTLANPQWAEFLLALDEDLEKIWSSDPFTSIAHFSGLAASTAENSLGELVTSSVVPYDLVPYPPGLNFYAIEDAKFQPGKLKGSQLGSILFDDGGAELLAGEDEVFLGVLSKPDYLGEWTIMLGSFSNEFRFCAEAIRLYVPLEGIQINQEDWAINFNSFDPDTGWLLPITEYEITVIDSGICDSSQFACADGIDLGMDTIICGGSSFTLKTDLRPEYNLLWSTGATSDSLIVTSSGNYSVMAWVDTSYGCDTLFDTISVAMPPALIAQYHYEPGKPEPGQPVHFTDLTSGIHSRVWNFGDGNKTIDSLASHIFDVSGEYIVTLVVSDSFGCGDTISFKLLAYAFTWKIPSAFSPNGNDVNEGFAPVGIGISRYELFIYNRWGQEVFHSENVPFDGTIGDRPLPEGVYVYKVKVWDFFGKYETASGNLTLVR